MPEWEKRASDWTHYLLYVLFFASPLSGWLYSSATGFQTVLFGVLPVPDLLPKRPDWAEPLKAAHRWINYALCATVLLHAAAAIKHHLVDRDDVLTRMRTAVTAIVALILGVALWRL